MEFKQDNLGRTGEIFPACNNGLRHGTHIAQYAESRSTYVPVNKEQRAEHARPAGSCQQQSISAGCLMQK